MHHRKLCADHTTRWFMNRVVSLLSSEAVRMYEDSRSGARNTSVSKIRLTMISNLSSQQRSTSPLYILIRPTVAGIEWMLLFIVLAKAASSGMLTPSFHPPGMLRPSAVISRSGARQGLRRHARACMLQQITAREEGEALDHLHVSLRRMVVEWEVMSRINCCVGRRNRQ